ncbi:MAG: fused MFS/spermidine synthase [Planctomycetota bacterium]|nr:fused MFS/spermidine synthase [Planctomycetota bacterium]
MRLFSYLVAFVSGSCVMMLQLLGTRVVGAFYGTGLFVWTALISVTLLALLVGYHVGGIVADRHPRGNRLGYLLAGAALLVFIIPLVSGPILSATDKLGIRLGLLVSSTVLFGLPLGLLGTVLPQVIRMRTEALDHVGRSSGSVYAVSSLGSIAGTVGSGFVLLPLFSTTTIMLAVGFALGMLGGAAVMMFDSGRWKARTIVLASVCATFVLGSLVGAQDRQFGRGRLLYEKATPHGTVRVVELEERLLDPTSPPDRMKTSIQKTRWLLIDMAGHSAVIGAAKSPFFFYTYFMRRLPFLRPEGKDGLLVGLGAGTIAMELAGQGVRVDSVEIEPAIEEVARRYFGFVPNGEVHIEDARYFLRNCAKRYDFIVMDVFSGGAVPFHLFSIEALKAAKGCLKPDGILAVNYLADDLGDRSRGAQALLAMLKRLFANRAAYLIGDKDRRLQNLVVFASDGGLEARNTVGDAELQAFLARTFKRMDACAVSCDVPADAMIPTDELNPLETWQTYQWEEMRRFVIERFFAGRD